MSAWQPTLTGDRQEALLDALTEAWRRAPQLRLGQLLVTAAQSSDPFHIADDDLLVALRRSIGWQP